MPRPRFDVLVHDWEDRWRRVARDVPQFAVRRIVRKLLGRGYDRDCSILVERSAPTAASGA